MSTVSTWCQNSRDISTGELYEDGEWSRQQYARMRSGVLRGSVDLCAECGDCEAKCPQKIGIREELKKDHTFLTEAEES